jgi:hypothetical protein
MNPYNAAVTDQIAKLGARNLSENILPSISDQFVSGGQWGSTRQGQMSDRALRDTQEAILAQQNAALQAGYGQAAGLSANDLARQAQLAGTAGGLGTSQQQILQGAASGLSNVGATGANIGLQAGQGIQSIGASNIQASQADLARQIQAATGLDTSGMNMGQLASMAGQLQLGAAQGLTGASAQQAANQLQAGQALTSAAGQQAANQLAAGQGTIAGANTAQNMNLQQTGALSSDAALTAANQQAAIDAQKAALASGHTAVINQIGAASNAISGGPQGGGTTSSTTTTPGPNSLAQAGGLLTGALATGKALGAAKGGPIKKDSLKKARYGNIPRRGLGMFARALIWYSLQNA